jgi:hypothetical protein
VETGRGRARAAPDLGQKEGSRRFDSGLWVIGGLGGEGSATRAAGAVEERREETGLACVHWMRVRRRIERSGPSACDAHQTVDFWKVRGMVVRFGWPVSIANNGAQAI